MKSLIYLLSVFVLLLLICTTYNLSIEVEYAPDNSISEVQVDRSLRKYKRETIQCKDKDNREEHLRKCNATFNEKLGTYYNVISMVENSQTNGGGVCSTYYSYGLKNRNNEGTGSCYLLHKSFTNDSLPTCNIYSCKDVSEWKSFSF